MCKNRINPFLCHHMENTTNISELPVDTMMPENYDLPEKHVTSAPRMDDEVILNQPEREKEKKVRFKEAVVPETTSSPTLKEVHKVIILAVIFFLLFSDVKIKSYLLNILVVVFGDYLKTLNGGMSKVGLVFYSVLYGLVLLTTVSLIDLSAMKLAF